MDSGVFRNVDSSLPVIMPTHTHIHARAHTHTRKHTRTHASAHIHAHTHARAHTRTHTRKHRHTHAHIHATHTHTTHARTHTHTRARALALSTELNCHAAPQCTAGVLQPRHLHDHAYRPVGGDAVQSGTYLRHNPQDSLRSETDTAVRVMAMMAYNWSRRLNPLTRTLGTKRRFEFRPIA
jgi:hypothetical protein